ncbi:hypothetical protein FACS1894137_10900 [Spirochaetia bacterium]|nr:hypothetical protein FACS1894137_10900 [Spirochaetia bacterium]
MKWKGLMALFPVIAGAMVFTACATQKGISGSAEPKQAKTIERVIVDYKGAVLGSDIPDWVNAAVDDDLERITRIPRFKGKVPFIDYGEGQNLDLLRSWVNNFNAQAGVSRRISNMVQANFGGEQLGNKNTPENNNFVKEIIATFSNTDIKGLAREMDYWIKLRTIDKSKGTETEAISYYVVYSIAEEDLNYQIAQAMGKIAARTQEQQEIKADVEAAMKRVAFNSIQGAE